MLSHPGAGMVSHAERPAHEQSLVEPFHERVKALQDQGVEGQAI